MSTLAYISTPPPTPHQLAIAHLASRLFPSRNAKPTEADNWFNKNAKYHHAMLRLITREALFGLEPSSYDELVTKVTAITTLGKPVGTGHCSKLHLAPLQTLLSMPKTWSDLQQSFELMEHVPDVYYEREDEGPHTTNRIAYVSPLGIFLRKVYLGYKTLSFQQTDTIREQVLDWCLPSKSAAGNEVESGAAGRLNTMGGLAVKQESQIQRQPTGPGGDEAHGVKHSPQRSSESIMMSMDISVSMDVSRTQEESMDLTQEESRITSAETPQPEGAASLPIRNQGQAVEPDQHHATQPMPSVAEEYRSNKRRRIVNKFTELDDTLDMRVKMFKDYQSACVKGDYSLALHSLDRFYNYRFPGHDKRLHQHALLNLASFHYNTGGLETARHILHEAIKVARIEGDKQCLLHCVSLSKRIEAETTVPVSSILVDGLPPHVADVGPDDESIPPLDELWNIKRRIDLGEALPAAYSRIWKALARQESIAKTVRDRGNPSRSQQGPKKDQTVIENQVPETLLADRAIVHGVQASLWHMFGSTLLGGLHEELSLGRSPLEQMRLSISIAHAQRLVTKSEYGEALATLLEPAVHKNLTISDYHRWVDEIWSLVELIIKRCGDQDLAHLPDHFRLPPAAFRQLGAGGPFRMIPDPSQKRIFDAFGRDERTPDRRTSDRLGAHISTAEDACTSRTPIAALPPLLGTLHTAKQLGLWNVYRQCSVKLSLILTQIDRNVQPNFAHPFQNRAEGQDCLLTVAVDDIEPIWDKILASEDDDMVFAGAYVLGCGNLNRETGSALHFGAVAMGRALTMGNTEKICSSAKLLAIANHKRGNQVERDVFAAFWAKVNKARNIDDWLQPDILNTVMDNLHGHSLAKSRLNAIWLWKHEHSTLERTISLLPEIIARVGVNIATNGV